MISKNVRYLRNKNSISQQELADALKVGRTSLGDYERGRTEPDISTMINLSDYFSISIDDMVRKDLQKEDYEIIRNKHMRVLAITVDKDNNENIDFPMIPEGTFRGFEIRGDSMLPMEPGNIVICSYVENISDIKDDKTYVVISREGGIVYKRLKVMKNQESLLLISDNSAYEPYTLEYSEIAEIWQYYAYISKSDPIATIKYIQDEKIEDIGRKVGEIYKEIIKK